MLKITNSAQIKYFFQNLLNDKKFKTTVLKRDTPKAYADKQDYVVSIQLQESNIEFTADFRDFILDKTEGKFYRSDKNIKLPISLWNKIIVAFDNNKNIIEFQATDPIIAQLTDKSKELKSANTKSARNLSTYETIQALVNEKGWYDGTPESISKYTKEDIELLKKYEGRGGLKGATIDTTSTGALNEFYTPEQIANMMYKIAVLNGFNGGRILEPSVGVGRLIKDFYNASPYELKGLIITSFEKDKVSATICKLLYPNINLFVKSFETQFYTGNVHTPTRAIAVANYDLVIGNPPYEKTGGLYIKEYESVGATQFDQYFLMRGLDLVKSGGLLIMIIPSTFLRNDRLYNPIKEQIAKKADLLQAFRLPNDVFPNTGVGTDIVCFRKK